MGKLIYGDGSTEIEFEDRLLAHLKVAIVTKLRRGETFTLSWDHGHDQGSGRSTIWLHPGIPLHFLFFGGREPVLNRAWAESMLISASSTNGMQIMPEPPQA
jgi:hypothetical protein